MSNAKRCDRCGKFYEMGWQMKVMIKRARCSDSDRFDLCPKCHDKLTRWMNKKQPVIEVDE